MSDQNTDEIAIRIDVAERIISQAWDRPIKLSEPEILRKEYRNSVLRCSVDGASHDIPKTVIIKASVGEDDGAYDSAKDVDGSTANRFFNEVAGTKFLNGVAAAPPLAAQLYGFNRDHGIFVIEDLGTNECLADRMQGTDPAKLEEGFIAYARSLGRMHGTTVGNEDEFAAIRAEVSGHMWPEVDKAEKWLSERVAGFVTMIDAMGVTPAPTFEAEAQTVASAIFTPGPFLAFTPGDTCPDNHRFVSGMDLCFFDFEFAGFRHALVDAAYLCMPFPTCWCVNRVPNDLAFQVIETYRAALVDGCPDAADDAIFFPTLAHACVLWLVETLLWNLDGAVKEDHTWGISTLRERHLLRLENTISLLNRTQTLPGMLDTATRLHDKLKSEWPEVSMPFYSPFRSAD